MMRRKAIRAGWGLVALGMVMLAVVVTVGAFRAHNDEAFNRWVGWATIWALVVAAIGVLLIVWDKVFPPHDGEANAAEIEGRLAKIVLAEAVDLRSRLIGADEVEPTSLLTSGSPSPAADSARSAVRARVTCEVSSPTTCPCHQSAWSSWATQERAKRFSPLSFRYSCLRNVNGMRPSQFPC